MGSALGKLHDWKWGKYIDPAGWYSQDGAWKSSTRLVHETSEAFVDVGDKWGWNTKVPEKGAEITAKDKKSFGRWGENTVAGIGAVFGGMYAAGGSSAGGAGAAAGEGTAVAGGGATAGEIGAVSGGTAGGGGGAVAGGGGAAVGGGAAGGGGSAGSGAAGGVAEGGVGVGTTESAVGSSEAATAGGGSSGWNWSNMMNKGGGAMQNAGQSQKKEEEQPKESDVDFEQPTYRGDPYAYSSKRLKTSPRTSMQAVMARGASGADPIDQNGVHMASIQALTKRLTAAQARLAKLKGKHA